MIYKMNLAVALYGASTVTLPQYLSSLKSVLAIGFALSVWLSGGGRRGAIDGAERLITLGGKRWLANETGVIPNPVVPATSRKRYRDDASASAFLSDIATRQHPPTP